jgi:hypothetical protein
MRPAGPAPAAWARRDGRFLANMGPPNRSSRTSGRPRRQPLPRHDRRADERLTGDPGGCHARTAHRTDPNASYEPATRTVTLCYELFKFLSSDSAARKAAVPRHRHRRLRADASWGTRWDVLDIPITGREEDAADQLATYLLLTRARPETRWRSGPSDGSHHAATARLSRICVRGCPRPGPQRVQHRVLDLRRDPARTTHRRRGLAPEQRRGRCPAEYRRFSSSWQRCCAPSPPSWMGPTPGPSRACAPSFRPAGWLEYPLEIRPMRSVPVACSLCWCRRPSWPRPPPSPPCWPTGSVTRAMSSRTSRRCPTPR